LKQGNAEVVARPRIADENLFLSVGNVLLYSSVDLANGLAGAI